MGKPWLCLPRFFSIALIIAFGSVFGQVGFTLVHDSLLESAVLEPAAVHMSNPSLGGLFGTSCGEADWLWGLDSHTCFVDLACTSILLFFWCWTPFSFSFVHGWVIHKLQLLIRSSPVPFPPQMDDVLQALRSCKNDGDWAKALETISAISAPSAVAEAFSIAKSLGFCASICAKASQWQATLQLWRDAKDAEILMALFLSSFLKL